METDLIMVKLVTGEWVIGRDGGDNEERNSFYLDKPYTVMVGTHPDGGWGTALIPYNMTNPNGSIEFSKGAVIAEPRTLTEELEGMYIETTTDIQLVKAH